MPSKSYDPEGTVESIVRDGLCTQCGFCKPVCPTDAISMQEHATLGEILPLVDADACVMCPLCLKVCPGEEVDFDRWYQDYLGVNTYDKYLGVVREAWLTWATDTHLRMRAASGGALTRLAQFALSEGYLDYIIFARPQADDPFRSETIITQIPADLCPGAGSLYYPVPLGEGITRTRLEQLPGNARLGIIGLPCHIHAAHKLTDTGWFRRLRWHYVFGIFCGGTWSLQATDTLLHKQGLRRSDIVQFTYRGGGWPGRIRWSSCGGVSRSLERQPKHLLATIDQASIFSANGFFTPERCMTCTDGLAELADLSFGDPWLKNQREEKLGKSLVLARTSRGAELLHHALAAGAIGGEPIEPELATVSQKGMLAIKRNNESFLRLARIFRGRAPIYNYKWDQRPRAPRLTMIYAILSRVNRFVGRRLNYRLLRIPLYLIQGLSGRLVKRSITLTSRDDENYFR